MMLYVVGFRQCALLGELINNAVCVLRRKDLLASFGGDFLGIISGGPLRLLGEMSLFNKRDSYMSLKITSP